MNHQKHAFEIAFTRVYQQYQNAHPAIREAMCLQAQFPAILGRIRPEDMIAGRVEYPAVFFSPHAGPATDVYLYAFRANALKEELSLPGLDAEYRARLEETVAFWATENTKSKLLARYTEALAWALQYDESIAPTIIMPAYRIGGAYLDFEKLVRLGLPGLKDEVASLLGKTQGESGKTELFEAMGIALDVLERCCLHYAGEALACVASVPAPRRAELACMACDLQAVTQERPRTFRQAMQLCWLYALLAGAEDYGRMDVYLGGFLARDLDSGALSWDEALALTRSLWKLIEDRKLNYTSRVVVGGMARPDEPSADRFALLAIETSRALRGVAPQLTLRFYKGMNPELMDRALTALGEGVTFPILYNDDVNVPAVVQSFDVSPEEAAHYVPFGCGEYVLDHRSLGTPSQGVNMAQALLATLNNGMDPFHGRPMGLALGRFIDFKTYEELYAAYQRQLEYHIDLSADMEWLEYQVANEEAALLYYSMLYDDCLAKGKAVLDGGVRYLGGTYETYGNTNTADSLTAIKYLVYDRKVLSPERMLAALNTNFEGYEAERELMRGAPKYGNDDDYADSIAVEVDRHVCVATRNQRNRTGLHSFLVVNINNSFNTVLGRWTAATPDGRAKGEPLANGNAPSGGADKKGVTAFLNSIVKPDPALHAGFVQNMKFTPQMFTTLRKKTEALLGAYFARGGTQAMITVVSHGDMEQALIHPEQYHNLIVRVGGFSARFVELPLDVQLELLSRTLY